MRLRQAIWGAAVAAILLAPTSTTGAVAPAGKATTAVTSACTSATMFAPMMPSPEAAGSTIDFAAGASTCTSPEYRFFLKKPGGSWAAQTAYGTGNWTWKTTGLPGAIYGIGVWARQIGSVTSHEAYWVGTFTLTIHPCSVVSVDSATFSPEPPGTVVSFMAGAGPCPAPLFRYWLKRPGGSFTAITTYSTRSSWTWNTRGYPRGTYQVAVWARQVGSTRPYEGYAISTYTLGNAGDCTSVGLQASPSGTAIRGTTVHFDASYACPVQLYEFLVKPPGGGWKVIVPFGAASGADWNTSGHLGGTWQVEVAAKRKGWSGFQAYNILTYVVDVMSCTAATISTDLVSPQAPGAVITLRAGSTDCDFPTYEFWLLPSSSASWVVLQPYGVGTTYTLDTAGAPPGPIQIGVWARRTGATASHDAYAISTFWLGS